MGMKASGSLIGAVLVLAACTPSPPSAAPSPSSSPALASPFASSPASSPALSPASEPSFAAESCAYPPVPIPDTAMVRDVFHAGSSVTENCVDKRAEDAYSEYLPDPCGRGLGVKTSSVTARRAIEVIFDDNPANSDNEASIYRHAVTVYNSADAASAYLFSVRAAVRECPTRRLISSTWKYTIIASTATRLDLSVHRVYKAAETGPLEGTFRVSIARAGAKVSVLSDVGWEGNPSYKSAVDALVTAAAGQLAHWE
jgi:hypothetical protein